MKKYKQVVDKVQSLIEANVLKEGEKIPSVRSMSNTMGFSVMTVLEGYRNLEDLNLIESRPQRGYFVKPKHERTPQTWAKLPNIRLKKITLKTKDVKLSPVIDNIIEQAARSDLIPLGGGIPDPHFFPSEELSLSLSRNARKYPYNVNSYCLGQGHEKLIHSLLKWMMQWNANDFSEEIQITPGCTQALLISLKAITKPGDIIAVESPGYFGFYSLTQYLDLKIIEIPSDPLTGFSVNALETLIKNGIYPKCILLSSTISNPTGSSMTVKDKEHLVSLCEENNISIIEDDTYGDIYFSGTRPKPLKYYSPDNVVYVGSFSKILTPGYRIAWVAGGSHSLDIMRCAKISILALPVITQLAVASYLKEGRGMLNHMRNLRKAYLNNMQVFQNYVAEFFPDGTRTCNPQGGHFLWIELPKEVDTIELSKKSIAKGISIAPGKLFTSREHYNNYLRLNCAVKLNDAIIEAIKTLGKLCD